MNHSKCYPVDLTHDSDIQELQSHNKILATLISLFRLRDRLGGGRALIEDFDLQYHINVRAAFFSQAMLPLLSPSLIRFVNSCWLDGKRKQIPVFRY
jgi:hypothetical protein